MGPFPESEDSLVQMRKKMRRGGEGKRGRWEDGEENRGRKIEVRGISSLRLPAMARGAMDPQSWKDIAEQKEGEEKFLQRKGGDPCRERYIGVSTNHIHTVRRLRE